MEKRSMLLALIACLSLFVIFYSSEVQADEVTNEENIFYSEELGAYVQAFKQDDSGEMKVLTEEEHDSMISDFEEGSEIINPAGALFKTRIESDNSITPMGTFYQYDKFIHTSSSNFTGSPLKVTNDIDCTTPSCSLGHGVTYTRTVSYSYGAASAGETSAIKSTLGITLSSAKAETSNFTFTLIRGDRGYVAFRPYMVKKSGYFESCSSQGGGCYKTSRTGYVNMSRKLSNGKADGVFYFAYTRRG